jgi:hypothetical protein
MSQCDEGEAEFLAAAQAMHQRLVEWRAAHPAASFDEIASEVRGERQVLMGHLLAALAQQHGVGELLVERTCRQCGGVLHYKGEKPRTVLHTEGQPQLERGYHHCDHCGHGFFPSG